MRITSVAEVFGGASGTGYVVGQDLILTASHSVADDHGVSVRTLGSADWIDADVVWRGSGSVDAALVRTRTPLPADAVDPVLQWGKAGIQAQISCRVTGFPAVAVLPDHVRDADTFLGQTVPGAGYKDGRLVIQSAGGPRDSTVSASPWAGMSGAAVFSSPESYLLGIVEKVSTGYPNNRLKVLPASILLNDPAFRTLVGGPAAHSVTTSGSVLRPPYASLPESHPESWLLEPRYAVVDFVDDGRQLDELVKWATSPEQFSIGAVNGTGGMGKSRLAAELAERLRQAGWDAGYLNTENGQSWRETSSEYPLLIIIDYASRFVEPLAGLVERLSTDPSGRPIRLLLLERRMGAWWETVNRLTRRLAQHHLGHHVTLQKGAISPELVSRHIEVAMSSLSRKFGVEPIPSSEVPSEGADSPLLIHIAVLLTLRGTDAAPATRGALLQALLDREVTRWEVALGAHKLGHLHNTQAAQLAAVASLVRPTRDEAKVLLAEMPEVCPPSDVVKAIEWLTDMLGSEDGVIRPIGPDLVVEHLLETLPDLHSLVLRLLAACDTVTAAHRARMFHLLSLSAQSGENSRNALTAALTKYLPELLETEISDVETQNLGFLTAALSASDKTNLALSRTAQRVAPTIPADSKRLAEVRAEVFELAIVRARKLAGGRIGDVPDELVVDERAEAFADLGLLLIHWGLSLGHLNGWGQAQAATLEAVEIFSALSVKFGNFGDRRQLAIAHSHAGKFFRNLDLHHESARFATKATELWRTLAKEDSDQKEDLAIALTNLADSLCSAGRPAEAIPYSVEAIAILRSELQQGHGSATPHLEQALSEVAHHWMDVGDAGLAWAAINEAATFKGFIVGEEVETDDLDSVGYLNGLAAELHLRAGNLEEAKSCATLSASAYGHYVQEFQANFSYFQGSLQRLLKVLDAAGDEEQASSMRADLAHLLVEPDPANYDEHIKAFGAFKHVIKSV
ncbi:Trypsin-like peptidase domain-containing protein [Micromonospora viridifaciens]|uniref:Trypsin-like peptidase domain-containing protein n=1 Tax=Micromonospora viridifaciens TaxID=1881 RepID=A0A1C4YX09_MICVI|nr:trypsin-like peptidase domain-containing protein [Micromonospora viridifaciens]SCF25167.1 Trypsin-like peptidase domain-containing protein [Micromonospora viridifaciens]